MLSPSFVASETNPASSASFPLSPPTSIPRLSPPSPESASLPQLPLFRSHSLASPVTLSTAPSGPLFHPPPSPPPLSPSVSTTASAPLFTSHPLHTPAPLTTTKPPSLSSTPLTSSSHSLSAPAPSNSLRTPNAPKFDVTPTYPVPSNSLSAPPSLTTPKPSNPVSIPHAPKFDVTPTYPVSSHSVSAPPSLTTPKTAIYSPSNPFSIPHAPKSDATPPSYPVPLHSLIAPPSLTTPKTATNALSIPNAPKPNVPTSSHSLIDPTRAVPALIHVARPKLPPPPPPQSSDVDRLPPHFTTWALCHMMGQSSRCYECINIQLDDISLLKAMLHSSLPHESRLPECRMAKQQRLVEAPELHRIHYSGYTFPFPAPPITNPVQLSFGREGGDMLTFSLLGYWEEWLPNVELRGTIGIRTVVTDPLLRSLDEKTAVVMGVPSVELYFPDNWKAGVFMNGVRDLPIPVRVKPHALQIPMVIRAHHNLILSTMDTQRTREDAPLLMLFVSFTPHPDCISRHMYESYMAYRQQKIPSFLHNAHLEMCYKLQHNRHEGKIPIRLASPSR